MAVTKVTGIKGTKGTNGANPTPGTKGGDANFTQNGLLGADSITVKATGGDGGAGGRGTGPTANGATGGNGGNASIGLAGNIFNNPAANNLVISGTATGGDGGLGGTSANALPGAQGNGGNGTVAFNGNIINPNKNMNNITLEAIALGGLGVKYGNASATINGNVIQPLKANNVTLEARASAVGPDDVANHGNANFGTKTATVNGNIIQGNIRNVTLAADAYPSNGTARVNGNIVQLSGNNTNTGTVALIASGNVIEMTQNKFRLGKQDLSIFITQYNPYTTTIQNNEFTGSGTNTFAFSSNAVPGPHANAVSVNLGAGTFVFNGQNNLLTGFANVTMSGTDNAVIIGSSAANILTAGAGNDILAGGAGNDTIDGGMGVDVAFYAGRETLYTTATLASVTGGPDGDDTLTGIERLKFLSPSDVSDLDNNGYGDLIYQSNVNGNIQIRTQGPGAATTSVTGVGADWDMVATGKFTADTNRNDALLLQNAVTQDLEIITQTAGVAAPIALAAPGAGWMAIDVGDFNGDATSDVLLQNGGNAQMIFTGGTPGTVLGTASFAAPTGYTAISSGDFNGDGFSDILWQDAITKDVQVSLMNGASTAASATFSPGPTFTAKGTGDFNNDGFSDILFQDGANAVIWTMNGTSQVGSPINVAPPVTPGTWSVAGAQDINSDGFSDILWRDDAAGNTRATLMTTGGTVLNGNFNLGAPAATFSLIASTGGG